MVFAKPFAWKARTVGMRRCPSHRRLRWEVRRRTSHACRCLRPAWMLVSVCSPCLHVVTVTDVSTRGLPTLQLLLHSVSSPWKRTSAFQTKTTTSSSTTSRLVSLREDTFAPRGLQF